jgi:hypothetical protein
MKVRALDTSGDWQFGRGQQSYRTEKNALAQNISTRLKSWKNDCFFAMDDGVNYYNFLDIGKKHFLDVDIKRVLLQTEGVLRISSYTSTLDHNSRDVKISATVETIYGTVTVSEGV